MALDSESSSKPRFHLSLQDGVILGLLLLGFIGTLFFLFVRCSLPPIVTAVLLAAAIAALVYRFLGGIASTTSFAFGLFKISGTLAALIGCAYFINQTLEQQTRYSLDRLFEPEAHRWFAVEKKPADLSKSGFAESALCLSPAAEELADIRLTAEPQQEGWIIRQKRSRPAVGNSHRAGTRANWRIFEPRSTTAALFGYRPLAARHGQLFSGTSALQAASARVQSRLFTLFADRR
jgi:hypothetical protein